MTAAGLSNVLHHLRRARPDGGESDADLLTRFTTAGDEAAFEVLVRRHGAMVLGVCRRVLGRHVHDAEDAFQAAFLILARKADSVVRRESLGCWLYRVAHRVALEARAAAARRSAREKPLAAAPDPVVDPPEPGDWRPILDEELARLPDRYRAPVILCELEGLPRRQAAALLGVPEGTLSSRLATARRLLAQRLARRGLAPAAAGLAVFLSEGAAAAVPPALVDSTVRSAVLVAAGMAAAMTSPAAHLFQGVLQTMFLTRLKLVIGVVMTTVALGAGGVVYQNSGPAAARAQTPTARPASELEALRKENELLKLNLQVVLEKVRAQEAELKALKEKADADGRKLASAQRAREHLLYANQVALAQRQYHEALRGVVRKADPLDQIEAALKKLREARDREAQRRIFEDLDRLTKQLRQQKSTSTPPAGKK
jgi:RNA polymerase sigma factor (sigma-70 family)